MSKRLKVTAGGWHSMQLRLLPSKLQGMRAAFLAQAEPHPEWLQYLKREKLDVQQLSGNHIALGICLCRCFEYTGSELGFEFHARGVPCAVIEAITFARVEGVIEPSTTDLVAWPLSEPQQFATALGPEDGCELLGALAAVDRGGQPLRLFRTPLEWLQADCQGAMPLKSGAGYWLRKCGGPFIVDDFDHATQIQALLGADAHMHRILLARPDFRRAA